MFENQVMDENIAGKTGIKIPQIAVKTETSDQNIYLNGIYNDKENSMDDTTQNAMNEFIDNKSNLIMTNQLNKRSLGDGPLKGFPPLENETPLFVTCGPNKAVLYLERLDKGSKGASILFEEWWLTPNEFQKVSGRGTAKDWKRSIKHHGRSLKLLMGKNMLFLNPPVCKCDYCSGNILAEKQEETADSQINEIGGEIVDQRKNELHVNSEHTPSKLNSSGHKSHSPGKSNNIDFGEKGISYANELPLKDQQFLGINDCGSMEVSPAQGNGLSDILADDIDKSGANGGGNPHRLNGENNFDQMNGTSIKLTSLTTGNPDNEGNNRQTLATKYSVPVSAINSTSTNERSEIETKINLDKYTSLTSTVNCSEVNVEIRGHLNMEFNNKIGNRSGAENSPDAVQVDDIDSSQIQPASSPGKAKEAEEITLSATPHQERESEKPGAHGPPYSTPLYLVNSPDKVPNADKTGGGSSNSVQGTDTGSQHAGSSDQENSIMSPNKEARLINIIEELKQYKKCLEVQIQEQKRSSQTQSANGMKSPVTVKPKSPKKTMFPIKRGSLDTARNNNGNFQRTFPDQSKDLEAIDHSSQVTGTVHWGMPKGHSPQYTSNHKTVMNYPRVKSPQKPWKQTCETKSNFNGMLTAGDQRKNPVNIHETYTFPSSQKLSEQLKPDCETNLLNKSLSDKSESIYASMAAQFMMAPTPDMNAYFQYISQCLKKGQIPNIYGFYNSLTKSVTKDKYPETVSPKARAEKRTHSVSVPLDHSGVLDLSTKKQKISEPDLGEFKVDDNGVLDLSTK